MDKLIETCLWPACVKTHEFAGQINAAVAGGFDALAIGGLTWRTLQSQQLTAADVRALANSHGIVLGHYDGFTDWAPARFDETIPDAAKAVFDFDTYEVLDVCAALGLHSVGATGAYAPGRFSLNQLADGFGAFCERAAAYGLWVDLEFIPFWGIPDLASAWDIVSASGAKNAGILFDTWHFCRGTEDSDLLASLPTHAITAIQVAGGQRPDIHMPLIDECLSLRTAPGAGDLDIGPALRLLARQQNVRSIGPEVFSDALDSLAAEEAGEQMARGLQFALRQMNRV
ncbi:MAG: sugar phosphate isomerase/epimerase family protein [Chromatocurvus sp.]